MDRLLWIGPRRGPPELRALLAARGVELLTFDQADAALAATVGVPVAAAVLTSTAKDLPAVVEKLLAARPELQVMLATDVGLPRPLALAMWSGATSLLDFRTQTREEILHKIHEALARHRQAAGERELLLRLRGLNEDFLKNVVAIEKRNIELEEQLRPETEALASTQEGPGKVLVVDDEDVVRNVLGMVLSKAGHPFVEAATGEAALKALREDRFQLVITDKNLPGMTGLEVLRQTKAASPETDVIMMTGYASMESAIEALNQGAAAYLEKPFDHVNTVLAKIEDVLARQRERNRKRRYLHLIKDRNRAFLAQYRSIRADLEAWLQTRGARVDDGGAVPPDDTSDGAEQPMTAQVGGNGRDA